MCMWRFFVECDVFIVESYIKSPRNPDDAFHILSPRALLAVGLFPQLRLSLPALSCLVARYKEVEVTLEVGAPSSIFFSSVHLFFLSVAAAAFNFASCDAS